MQQNYHLKAHGNGNQGTESTCWRRLHQPEIKKLQSSFMNLTTTPHNGFYQYDLVGLEYVRYNLSHCGNLLSVWIGPNRLPGSDPPCGRFTMWTQAMKEHVQGYSTKYYVNILCSREYYFIFRKRQNVPTVPFLNKLLPIILPTA